jgi:arsenate reductase
MAAGLLKLRSNGRIGARSAGTAPADEMGAVVVAAMREVGVDVWKNVPRPLSTDDVRIADVVVTMGCGDSCPVIPGRRYEDWALDDPSGQDLEMVRRIRGRDRHSRAGARAGARRLAGSADPPGKGHASTRWISGSSDSRTLRRQGME